MRSHVILKVIKVVPLKYNQIKHNYQYLLKQKKVFQMKILKTAQTALFYRIQINKKTKKAKKN